MTNTGGSRAGRIVKWVMIIVVFAMVLTVGAFLWLNREKKSEVQAIVEEYRVSGKLVTTSGKLDEEGTATLFLEGLRAYEGQSYESAARIFQQVLDNPDADKAELIYSYYYLNQIQYRNEGKGNKAYVEKIITLAENYKPISNDVDLIWNTVMSISQNVRTDIQAKEYLERYLVNAKNLTSETKICIRNKIAILQYYSENSAIALRNFNNVLSLIEASSKSDVLVEEGMIAKGYMGDINYHYKDYASASRLYREVLDTPIEDAQRNATLKYIYYINSSVAYLEQGDYEKVKATLKEFEGIIPLLETDISIGCELTMNDIYAQTAILESDYEAAQKYIKKCEQLATQKSVEVFYGESLLLDVTKAKLMYEKGDYAGAEKLLAGMEDVDEYVESGISSDRNKLLLDIYEKTGNLDQFIYVARNELETQETHMEETEKNYLEFSRFYAKAERLQEQNSRLKQISITVVLILVFAVLLVILILTFCFWLWKVNLVDSLTGIYNRKMLSKIIDKYKKHGHTKSIGIIMMDIDYFKKYNDTYGHLEGDTALKRIAQTLKKSLRKDDIIIRYGGEEFLVILEGVPRVRTEEICRRIKENVEEERIPHRASTVSDHMTLSIGLCYKTGAKAGEIQDLIRLSDEALYESKKNGRNQITVKIVEGEVIPAGNGDDH